mmetsp:Transcript_61564/g.190711  ORF Transcript_61564/g.190711 Transcript_61564/m.190711 type:complete len:1032 (-) Transcript_61564:113-3208(-)
MDVTFGDAEDLPQVIESLSLKGFCTIDAAVCGPLTSKVLTEVQQRFSVGRFAPPPSAGEVRIADGLLGPEGSARVAPLTTSSANLPNPADQDGKAVTEMDEFMTELSLGLAEYLPALGMEASTRSIGMIHETTKAEQPIQELTEMEASNWNGTFATHRLMVLFFLGPEEGTLELGLFGEDGYAAPIVVKTGSNMMVILRPDLISRSHTITSSSKKSYVFSCFVNSMKEATLRGSPVPAYREALGQWMQDRMRELKDQEAENEAVLDDLPRAWVRAMNSQFYRGQQACVRSSACKLPGPIGWDPQGLFPTALAGADYILEVPHRRFNVDDFFYKNPAEELWTEYKTYSRHGSFIDGEHLFDNKQFSVTAGAAAGMPVSERWGLEVGYESLFMAGWNKKKLQRAKGDVLTGVHSTENQFNNKYGDTSVFQGGGSVAREANMISFTLNIMGQSLTIDTDGSSSLVAIWQGSLEQSDNDENGRKPPFSLCLGTAWNVCPAVFANFCQRRLLTTHGRCFAFDEKATGFVRGEGCGGLILDHLHSIVDGDVVVQDNGQGIVRACDMMQCGKGAVLAAPSGVVIQETMALTVRNGGMQPGDIDVLECHAPGSAIHDIPEANGAARVMRSDSDTNPLLLTDTKSLIGNTYAGAGIIGFLKVMHCMRNALVGAHNMVRVLNPNIDMEDKPLNIMTEPFMLPVETTGFTAVNSFGNSGSYATAIVWADRMELFAPPEAEGKGPAACVFWPGGGGELEESAIPTEAYYVAGSFGQWANPVKMEEKIAGSGEWTATIALGENNFEQFQIWLDGSKERVIHPGRPRAPKTTQVMGPEEREACSLCTWQIDGRPMLVYDGGEVKELPNKDKSVPGTHFLVRLRVAGKYRIVDWDKLEEPLATPAPSSYHVVGSWSNWEFQEMTSVEPGVWSCEATLDGGSNEFAIVRNEDWSQAFFPAEFNYAGRSVYGPDDWGRGLTWCIGGEAGDVYEIKFRRKIQGSEEDREVSWQHVRGGSSTKPAKPTRSAPERVILSSHCVNVDLDMLS